MRPREGGSILVALLAALAIASILSAVAFPAWADVLRRDNEAEMIFRAQDLARALRKYRRDRGQLPAKLEDLAEPGSRGQYFLRHLYKDPLVRGGKWGLLYAAPGGGVVDPNGPEIDPKQLLGLGTEVPDATERPGGRKITTSDLSGGTEVTGLPIAGVKSLCKEKPFRKYRDRDEYADWQFTVFDLDPQQGAPTGGAGRPGGIGTPAGPRGRPGGAPRGN